MNDHIFEKLKKASLVLAKYSFIIGSVIFFSFILTGISSLQITGFIYNVIACAANGLFLLALFGLMIIYPKRYWDILQLMLILLFNVPVAIFYLWIATAL